MIVLTGAGGRLGQAVLTALLEKVDPHQVGVSTTRPELMEDLALRGVRVREGSFDAPKTLEHAFEGADRVLIVSAPRQGAAAIEAHRGAIRAAQEAGVTRLFYTSHVGADALSPFPPAVTHATTETMIRDSGLAFTVLRNGFYADTPARLIRAALASGELRTPVDAPVSWTWHQDLGPGIAELLLQPNPREAAVNLTAGQAYDMGRLAALASDHAARPIKHVVLSDEAYADELREHGATELSVTMTLGIFRASRQRHLGITDPALTGLINRPTTPISQILPQ